VLAGYHLIHRGLPCSRTLFVLVRRHFTAPSLIAFQQGVGMTRKHGTCVLVGLPPGEFPVPIFDVAANCITIRGSFVGTRQDMAEALAFAAQGKVKADIELQPLSAINEVFERLEHGDVPSRVALDFAHG
jgi:alcohol dehydrogenase, propanol-preferring